MPEVPEKIVLITEFLNAFIRTFDAGFVALRPEVEFLTRALITIDILVFFFAVTLGAEQFAGLLKRLLGITTWLHFIRDFHSHGDTFVTGLVRAGLTAAGQARTNPRILFDPSALLEQGFVGTQSVLEHLGPTLMLSDGLMFLLGGITYVLMWVAYGVVALSAFMAVLEYYFGMLLSVLLIPFVLTPWTKWIGMKPLSILLASGIHLMVLSFLLVGIQDIIGGLPIPADVEPKYGDYVATSILAVFVIWITAKLPLKVTQGFMSGAASMGGGALLGAAAGAVAGAGSVARHAGNLAGGGQKVGGASVAAGKALATGVQFLAGAGLGAAAKAASSAVAATGKAATGVAGGARAAASADSSAAKAGGSAVASRLNGSPQEGKAEYSGGPIIRFAPPPQANLPGSTLPRGDQTAAKTKGSEPGLRAPAVPRSDVLPNPHSPNPHAKA